MQQDLSGRHAVVTGGRIKIGFHIVLKLLRSGARVTVTSRFVGDALRRFQDQPDYPQWQSRLRLYALDLRHIHAVEGASKNLSGEMLTRRKSAKRRSLLS